MVRRGSDWYAGLLAVHAPHRVRAPAHGLGIRTAFKRRTLPIVLRVGARLPARVLRVDVHPADFDLPTHMDARRTPSSPRRAAGAP